MNIEFIITLLIIYQIFVTVTIIYILMSLKNINNKIDNTNKTVGDNTSNIGKSLLLIKKLFKN